MSAPIDITDPAQFFLAPERTRRARSSRSGENV
jgi:hypothetical protein